MPCFMLFHPFHPFFRICQISDSFLLLTHLIHLFPPLLVSLLSAALDKFYHSIDDQKKEEKEKKDILSSNDKGKGNEEESDNMRY
jgi:hypothetical protein